MSWTSIKDSILMLISFVTFFLLYISVYIADAAITYAWVLLYVFSPLMIALYVLPVTSGATKALYRSLFEVSAWKIVWSVLATLLWSAALSQINQPGNQVNFITAVSFNLILAASLLLTPLVVNALAGAGIASLAAQTAGIAAGAAAFSPGQLLTNIAKKKISGKSKGGSEGGGGGPGGPASQFREDNNDKDDCNPLHSKSGRQRTTVQRLQAGNSNKSSAASTSGSTSFVTAPSVPSQSPKKDLGPTVSFKAAAAAYQPPENHSEYQKQPIQRAMFVESKTRTNQPK